MKQDTININAKSIDCRSSKAFQNLRAPLIVCVIFIHATGSGLIMPLADDASMYNFIRFLLSTVLTQVAVPTFFVISSYLFFWGVDAFTRDIYRQKLKKRFTSVFVPYLIFVGLSLVITCAGKFVHHNPLCLNLDLINKGVFSYHLWYIRELMLFFFLSPLIYVFVQNKLRGAIVLFVLVAMYVLDPRSNTEPFSSQALLFCTFGSYMSYHRIDLIPTLQQYRRIIVATSSVLLLVLLYGYYRELNLADYVFPLFIISGALSALALGEFIKLTAVLGKSSFFVYLTHVYMIPVTALIYSFLGIGGIMAYLSRPFVIYGLCTILYMCFQKFMPEVLALLTGNRN